MALSAQLLSNAYAMKFLVITQSNGRRGANEYDCPSFDYLQRKLAASGIEDYQAYCEISDLVESLSMRVSALERRLDASDEALAPKSDNPNIIQVSDSQRQNPQSQSNLLKIELVDKYIVQKKSG